MVHAITSKYVPDKSVIYLSAADVEDHSFLLSKNPELKQQLEVGKESAAVFICENFTCSIPIRSLDDLKNRLTAMPSSHHPPRENVNNEDATK